MSAAALAPLAWLIGEWEAEPDASGATGGSRFSLEAGGNAILRANWADNPPMQGRPAARHDDMLVIHEEAGSLVGLYVDSEGHVIRYAVKASDGGVVLTSQDAPGPRFRLTYRKTGDASASVDFEIAPPGQDFARYVGGAIRRR